MGLLRIHQVPVPAGILMIMVPGRRQRIRRSEDAIKMPEIVASPSGFAMAVARWPPGPMAGEVVGEAANE